MSVSYNGVECAECLDPVENQDMTHASSAWSTPVPRADARGSQGVTATLWIATVIHSCIAGIIATNPAPEGLPTWFPWALAGLIGLEVVAFSIAAWNLPAGWPLLVGVILLKVGGIVTSLVAWGLGTVDASLAIPTALFDAFWTIALYRVLAWVHRDQAKGSAILPLGDALHLARDQAGRSLMQLSQESPVLVVFLRHFGCTFCREALADLSKQRPQIEANGTTIALVHMGTEDEANFMLERYGLSKIHHISDPLRRIYRSFSLRRGSWGQLFGWKVWQRGFQSGILEGHGLGRLQGDGFQMPGAFLVDHGQIVAEYRHSSASDRPDYRQLAASRS
jgi:peroxiredoxin